MIVEHDNSLCCVNGSVRDENSNFLEGVKVSIGDVFTMTDENGRFAIKIPTEKRKEEQTITAYKESYAIFEDQVWPATKAEVKIILRKKQP